MRRHPPELRSSPRKRGFRVTERGPWIPACAGMNGMERREFIALLAAAAAWPVAARAQQPQRIRRVCVLMAVAESDVDVRAVVAIFPRSLQELGWSDGRNLRIG